MQHTQRPAAPGTQSQGVPSLLFLIVPLLLMVTGLCVVVPYLQTPVRPILMTVVGGPFQLEDGAGRKVTERSWPGKYLLIYFGYTHCPAVCPTTLANMTDALDRLGRNAGLVQPLFITVDPARDTPSVMARYTAMFSPSLTGLSGTAAQIAEAAAGYGIYYAPHRTGPGPNDYSMDHSSVVYLMAPDGHKAATIDAAGNGETMAASIETAMRKEQPAS